MKYYLIAGEASGDLHASHLMAALKEIDNQAEFRFFGGDLMASVGGTLVKHYKELAYMSFIPVLLHLHTILVNMKHCKEDIVNWMPDVIIPVDYPGFNLHIAKFIKAKTNIPVYYYISPKIWAWKEYRIKNIKRDINELFSILPFEVEYYKKHQYPVHYIGNPSVDEVVSFKKGYEESFSSFTKENQLSDKPIIALLAGSRKQEIKNNLPDMLKGASGFSNYQLVLAGASSIDYEYYKPYIGDANVKILFGQTFRLLQHSYAALVTSGTATLETALFRVPQVVCYHMPMGKIISFLKKRVLKVRYISLVNLIVGKEVVKELVADTMTVKNIRRELDILLHDKVYRQEILEGYEKMTQKLGEAGASHQAARLIINLLKNRTA
ncbi:Lipid-A-disaccharide synthase [termite gut metagenome]|uniref:lipid-A-disaccharide synthase n=1 Tax=termite gut metagenome TaxID=433724 RepID=A0A5J4RSQ5_9ZZZZ